MKSSKSKPLTIYTSFLSVFLMSTICTPASLCAPVAKAGDLKPSTAGSVSTGKNQTAGSQVKMPADGPDKMYMRYHERIMDPNSTVLELSPYISAESRKGLNNPAAGAAGDQMLGMIRAFTPKNVTIKKVQINGNKAKLFLATTDATPNPLGGTSKAEDTRGTALYVIEDGLWKLEKENWRTSSGKKNESPDPNWCLQAANAEFPRKRASGKIHGRPFQVERAEIDEDHLLLREGTDFFPDRAIELWFHDKKVVLENRSFTIEEDADSQGPNITMKWKEDGAMLPESKQYFADDGAGMRLQFMKRNKDGTVPVWIILRLPDKDKSYVEGFVEADIKKVER